MNEWSINMEKGLPATHFFHYFTNNVIISTILKGFFWVVYSNYCCCCGHKHMVTYSLLSLEGTCLSL